MTEIVTNGWDRLRMLSPDDNIQSDRDLSLDALLELDGVVFAVEDTGCYWVKFEVTPIRASPERRTGCGIR
jgi:hypothetical protein